jgi:hypothetical protein
MRKYFLTALIGVISLLLLTAFTDDPFAELLKKLDVFVKKHTQEKVYLHFDKPYYAIGDNIWFKAYIVDGRTSLPTTTSNILYVELINSNDSITKQIKLPMQSGITWGDFKLSDSLSEGNYRIRAYTQWMRNAGPAFFFDKTIKIGNGWTNKVFTKADFQHATVNGQDQVNCVIKFSTASSSPYPNAEVNYQLVLGKTRSSTVKAMTNAKGEINIPIAKNATKSGFILATITLTDGQKVKKQIPIITTNNNVDVQFFPEGGNLIEGLPNKVAMKVTNAAGLGENISGVINDNEGIEVLAFETFHLGMGSFSLNPMTGKTYTAKIKFKNGSEKIVALPKAQVNGYALTLNNLDSAKMNIKVMLSADLLNKGELSLLAQHNGNILFSGKVPTSKQIVSVVVPKTEFPSGIVTLTLFDQQNQAVAERLAFVNNISDKINVAINDLKPSYGKKGAVEFSLNFSNREKPVQGSFSVTVTNANVVIPDPDNESNILTSLLLTSDLKGYIEKPNQYFLNNDVETKIALDHLLLTQGWRKINWGSVLSGQEPALGFPAEKAMKISGKVTDNGKPVVKGKVSLLSSSNGIFATDTETDENGRFIFDQIAFNDSTKFAIKAVTSADRKGVKITMDDVSEQLVTFNPNNPEIDVNVNETLKNYLVQSADYFKDQEAKGFLTRVNQLKAVEITGKINKASSLSSNLNGPGQADAVFSADELKNSVSLTHFLNGRVAGLNVTNGLPNSTRTGGVMTVFVDGSKLIDGQTDPPTGNLEDITLLDIESIEILKSVANLAAYGHVGKDGVIIITTKSGKGRTTFNTRAAGMLPYSPKGFYTVRTFYSPKYDVKTDDKPDYRPTVFWEPHLVSDAAGKATLKYFNTDQTGTFRIVIEGIDGEGNLARKVLTYQTN